jgi:hypothetical protein
MPFTSAPATNTHASLSDGFSTQTVQIQSVGYEKLSDTQTSFNTKIYYGPGISRTPKVITFKNQ